MYHWTASDSLSLYLDELFDWVEMALEDRYNEMVYEILTVEIGVNRGMAASAGKRLPKLPAYEKVKGRMETDKDEDIWWVSPPNVVMNEPDQEMNDA